MEKLRSYQSGSRSGFYGGVSKDTARFEAAAPGTASVVFMARHGAGRPLAEEKSVQIKILAS